MCELNHNDEQRYMIPLVQTSPLLLLDVPALLNNINNNNVTDPDLDLLFDALYPPHLLHQGDTEDQQHQTSRQPF